jgi:ABC-type transport system substrate-binding protein
MARLIVQQLADVGIKGQARPHPFDEYTRFAVGGSQQLFSFGWIGLYDSPDAYLTPLFSTGGPDNITSFAHPDVQTRLSQARRSTNAGARATLWRDAERVVLSRSVIIPIAQFRAQLVVDDDVNDLDVRTDGTFDVAKITLD